MKNYIIYKRVSTDKQGIVGLGMQAQEQSIQEFLATQSDYHVLNTYAEAETGTQKRKRPMLHKALEECKANNATLVVATLSRLSRNVHFISGLVESNVSFIALDLPSCDKTMLFFLATIAEWEADTISKRTKAALEQLQKNGVKLGPKYKKLTAEVSEPYRQQWNNIQKQRAFQFSDRMYPILKFYKDQGLNNSKIAEEMNLKKYATPSGRGSWKSETVARCIRRTR